MELWGGEFAPQRCLELTLHIAVRFNMLHIDAYRTQNKAAHAACITPRKIP
jgi:hypothetical protein